MVCSDKMAKGKARVIAARLMSAAGTGFYYTIRKPRNRERMVLRKYDPVGIVNDATSTLVQQRYLEDADFERFQLSYLPWSTPIILVTCTGVLIGLLFLVVGCCLCGCSCLCKLKKETTYRPKLVIRQTFRRCICWNSITVISGVFVLFGCVMACVCAVTFNKATYSMPSALQQTASTIVGYLNTTKQEFGSQLSSGLEQTADCINGQVNDIPAAAGEAVLSSFDLMDHTENVTTDCLEVLSIAKMTVASAQVLTHHHQSLVAKLSAISQSSSELLLNCTALELGGSCGVLQELRNSLSTISTMQLPDLVGNATVLQNYLEMNLKPSLSQVRDILANISADFASVVDSQIGDTVETVTLDLLKAQSQNISESFASIVVEASQLTMNVLGWLENLLSVAPSSLTSDAPERSTLALLLSLYNYSYFIGVVFCVLFGLVLIALAICLILGCVAYERIPQTRDRKAQHMKRCFRLLIFFIFIVAFVSIALASYGYFVGANMHEVCEGWRGPDYSALSQTLDDPQWRLSNLQQMLQSANSQAFLQPIMGSNISSSTVLSQCFGGATSWQVLDLEDALNSLNSSDLSLHFIQETLGSGITTQQSLLADAVSTALTALSDLGPVNDLASAVNTISQQNATQQPLHYAQFLGSLQTVLSAAKSVQGQVGNLKAQRSAVDTSNQTSRDLRDGLAVLIQEIEDLETLVAGIERQAMPMRSLSDLFPVANERMQGSLDRLSSSVGMFLADLNNDMVFSLMSAMEAVMCKVGQVRNYSTAVEDLVYYNTSSCYPLWEAYATAYTATCVNLLGSLNGLWFAMGWCVLGLIPLLVGLLGVQSHFVKAHLPDRRSTSNVTANLTRNTPVALIRHSARQHTLPPVEGQRDGLELEVVENAWTGEVISLSQDGDTTEDYYVNDNRNIDPGSEAGRGRDRNYFGKYSWTLPLADHEVHENENTLISQAPPSYENLI